ncbi:MAG TPA: FAD-binding oxidoreductase [Vicinamibacterales bacterium]|jgi:glycine/D-amino acid oxidase-like deaminating enzyme|nr:FAD-binding oxidoreductase [Vicinamibacterales bacterium]
MTTYGVSPWIDGFPPSRVPSYPKHRGSGTADVVIVGGGLTGCVTAYAFAAAGVRPVLLESGQIGRGASGGAAGIISDDPGVDFADLSRALGARRATIAWQAWRRAALDFQALLRRLEIRCALEARPSLVVAATPEQAARLAREEKARREAGFGGARLNARAAAAAAGFAASSAIRTAGAGAIDPYRATLGLAAAAAARGARLFERTEVRRITFTRKVADVLTADGAIRTGRVVIATGTPTRLFHSLQRHFWFHRSFFALTAPIPARVRQLLGGRDAIVRDLATPAHRVRWVDGDRLLVGGADADSSESLTKNKLLIQRTGQLMYELSTLYPDVSGTRPDYGWEAPYARTADGLPYFGAHRNFPFHLFAFGDSSHSVTGAYLASRIFLREHLGERDAAADAFGFHR